MRRSSFAARITMMLGLLLFFTAVPASIAAQESTPAASPAAAPTATPPPTPVVVTAPAGTPAAPTAEAAQAAPTAAPVQTNVVTMAFWYANSATADILELYPLATDATFVASQGAGAAVGSIDFPEDGSAPTVIVGETTFTTYPRADGVVERWTWLDDFEGARPATLVMQLSGQGGAYQDFYGTATMMSRDEGGAGGVLIVALRPPSADAQAEPAAAVAETGAAEVVEEQPVDVIVEEAPVDEGVITEEVPVDDGSVITEEVPQG